MKKFISILLFFSFSFIVLGQNGSIIIKDNANIIMNGNVNLITSQSNVLAIQKIGNLQGGIISDNEQSRVIWQIGTGVGNYIVPFKISNTQIPFSINITVAGTGVGKLLSSTYHSAMNNTPYPNGNGYFPSVTNMNYNGADNSVNVVDRFWMINYADYTFIPTSQFTMTYDAANDLNGIIENNLQAQYWNGITWILPPTGVANPPFDNVNSISSTSQSAPWVLVNKLIPLPIGLLSFEGDCENGVNVITWVTASEINVDYFILKSHDYIFNSTKVIDTIPSHGQLLLYSINDYAPIGENMTYYSLSVVDLDGSEYLATQNHISIPSCYLTSNDINVWPNPANEGQLITISGDVYSFEIYDILGRVLSAKFENNKVSELPSGIYIFIINNKFRTKVIIK